MKHFFILMLLLLGCYNSFAFEYKGVYYRESEGGPSFQNRKMVELILVKSLSLKR